MHYVLLLRSTPDYTTNNVHSPPSIDPDRSLPPSKHLKKHSEPIFINAQVKKCLIRCKFHFKPTSRGYLAKFANSKGLDFIPGNR
ncbi:hypothetical protein O6P43_026763 [Quillaja saponaria]|uniref:Uncharacterized protein n=1 Tax=Quillaja saponaria TaxID=32244 RepID=A0AAD7L3B2_QUISA|nr:hypothetical protein O6P43_026763 [Quillaja saponaria]